MSKSGYIEIRSITNRPTEVKEVHPLYVMTESEERFAEIIWKREPIGSGELVILCGEAFQWKKSTTYTVLKKLCEKGLFINEDAVVTSLIDKAAYRSGQSVRFVEEVFQGSLPHFLTAFVSGKKLTPRQAEELKQLIDAQGEEE